MQDLNPSPGPGPNPNSAPPSYDYVSFPRQFLAYRWYKPLLVALLTFIFTFVYQITLLLVTSAVIGGGTDSYIGTGYDDMDTYSAPGAILNLGSVALMWLALATAMLIVRDRPHSSYSSSRGGWHWRGFVKCFGIAVVLMLLNYLAGLVLPTDAPAPDHINRFTTPGLILCIFIIPLQCVAEEYIFRAFIMQTVGSWIKVPVLGLVASIAASAAAFAAGHPYNDIGVIAILLNGIAWCFLTWKTRGIEASSALHIANNYLAFFMSGLGLQAITSQVPLTDLVLSTSVDIIYIVTVVLLDQKYHWFYPLTDGTKKYNDAYRQKQARKAARRGLPVAPDVYGPNGQNVPYGQGGPYGQDGPYNQPTPYGQNAPYNHSHHSPQT
jgi:membrane protease YdiL (CAAX protease family)